MGETKQARKKPAQLLMYFLPGTPIPDEPLPEGYSLVKYRSEEDIEGWKDCCRDGLGDQFDRDMRLPGIDPERDIFFLDHEGKHIGTGTAFVWPKSGYGVEHMVGIRPEYRGKGLSKYLTRAILRELTSRNVPMIQLRSDDWRKGAVKGYLDQGFLPVDNAPDMQGRWENLLEEFGIEETVMLDMRAVPEKKIFRAGSGKEAEPIGAHSL